MAPAAYPRIAGLNAEYMAKQLKDFQSGRRGNPVMMPMAKNLTDAEIDAGRLAESAPLWAAWVAYPAYRAKNKKVNTYIERIQGCFTYSMNAQGSAAGAPPSADSDTIVSLIAYSYWLAKGAPTGDETMPGRDYPRLRAPQRRDSTRNGGRPSTPPGAPFATARTEPA